MRKVQQEKILGILDTVKDALNELSKTTVSNEYEELVYGCQECMTALIKYITDIEGAETKVIRLLEDYYEILANIYQKGNPLSNSNIKLLKMKLYNIENKVKSELRPNRIEVVFFPYQLAMWDSLESIYIAAKSDPECDVYCVPIPWFDKLPNGEFGQMHYDGNQYPPSVDVTDWKEYDVEAHHPDIIYIHNPYDDGNLVTSIHPYFYSRRLLKFTDCLCYIPYFVVENGAANHFVATIGCAAAHKIIVESEEVRDVYIQEYKDAFGSQLGSVEKKFIALGSPKYDKVAATKLEEYELPEEWEKVIVRNDGKRKKVVLYNTSVVAMLHDSKRYMEKMRSVFNVFENRNDVVLLWRPHPLMQQTIYRMRPQLLEEYLQIVEDYKNLNASDKAHNNFIYDSSEDLHRAIAVSDAYFGDKSSVAKLYQKVGKPVFYQNIYFTFNEDEIEELRSSDIVLFGTRLLSVDKLSEEYPEFYEYSLLYKSAGQSKYVLVSDYDYGISATTNAFYKLKKEKGKAIFLALLSNKKFCGHEYHPPLRINNTLIFSPRLARKWAFYHIDANEWHYKEIPIDFLPVDESHAAFNCGVVYNNSILFLPGASGTFAKFDLDNEEITYHQQWYIQFKEYFPNQKMNIFCSFSYYKNSLVFASSQTNTIFEIDPVTISVIKTYKLNVDISGFKHAVMIPNTSDFLFIVYRDQSEKNYTEKIIKWNIETGKIEEFNNLPINLKENSTLNALNAFLFFKGFVYITPLQGDTILKYNIQTDEISRFTLIPEYDFYERKNKLYTLSTGVALPFVNFNIKTMKYTIALLYDYSFADLDIESGEISNRTKWYVECEYLHNDKEFITEEQIVENLYFTIDDFLKQLASISTESVKSSSEKQGTAGENIYNYLKSEILNL